jgi:hypothetical protein
MRGPVAYRGIDASDNTCESCRAGYQTSCVYRQPGAASGGQADYLRVPLADGTLVGTSGLPDADLITSLLTASDGLGAHSVIEAVGTQESMMHALRVWRARFCLRRPVDRFTRSGRGTAG